ncbi:hypothetical protein BDP27DRAFT_1376932 [Rhodocollybia butyracea]|uniref:Uncharacterized protein n=1 Tax=Rhodocollybia butyracea TaxID=206335 RepID=A0A9P5TVU6_9AGAR|nr:hypothetical protein BDP27DRAFT_1376932 [Rhodocollybia butyracea]
MAKFWQIEMNFCYLGLEDRREEAEVRGRVSGVHLPKSGVLAMYEKKLFDLRLGAIIIICIWVVETQVIRGLLLEEILANEIWGSGGLRVICGSKRRMVSEYLKRFPASMGDTVEPSDTVPGEVDDSVADISNSPQFIFKLHTVLASESWLSSKHLSHAGLQFFRASELQRQVILALAGTCGLSDFVVLGPRYYGPPFFSITHFKDSMSASMPILYSPLSNWRKMYRKKRTGNAGIALEPWEEPLPEAGTKEYNEEIESCKVLGARKKEIGALTFFQRIRQWIKYHGKDVVTANALLQSTEGKVPQARAMKARLLHGVELIKPCKKPDHIVWDRDNKELVKRMTEELVDDYAVEGTVKAKGKGPSDITDGKGKASVVHLWNLLSTEEKTKWEQKAVDEHNLAMEEYQRTVSGPPSTLPAVCQVAWAAGPEPVKRWMSYSVHVIEDNVGFEVLMLGLSLDLQMPPLELWKAKLGRLKSARRSQVM